MTCTNHEMVFFGHEPGTGRMQWRCRKCKEIRIDERHSTRSGPQERHAPYNPYTDGEERPMRDPNKVTKAEMTQLVSEALYQYASTEGADWLKPVDDGGPDNQLTLVVGDKDFRITISIPRR